MGRLDACLYRADVTHRRPGPPRYRFRYRTYHLLLDLDGIDAACAASAFLSRNRFNLLSFHDRDHGPHDGRPLRPWAESVLAEHDIDLAGGRIRLLCMPRVLGYGFNPISLYYCHHADTTLRAVLAEVHNTFGEHHVYVLHDAGRPMAWQQTRTKTKRFHVSPFFDRSGEYRFHLLAPEARLGLGIRLYDEAGALRIATAVSGHRRVLSSREILIAAVAVPWMSAKVTLAIHWQALKLWCRGAGFRRRPAPERPNRS
ncbi:DUF1365 domain-containing protein [Salinisphaera sp. Q1T1-3]|uniref:DUF1365 domain-containing protein n=1 Tax=Salinisphaera sp. Q1T1-3 TaxID=2321229 RepID=UPI000E7539A2|nr:DUF1365 domain-containing protein [Salinisphaera sp. Q1T1-3]RJS94285.1 DUF1365 domain-containing protein [Salinisphaera sp. Q1T1-3]